MSKEKMQKVKFLTSPTGEYKLAYNAGDQVEVPLSLAVKIVNNGDGEFVGKGPTEADLKKLEEQAEENE